MGCCPRRVDPRLVDAALFLALVGSGGWLLTTSPLSTWRIVGAAGLLVVGAIIGLSSWRTSAWLTKLHENHNAVSHSSLRHMRKVGKRMPCPYPDAWWAVGLTQEIPPGTVLDVTVCGHNLIVFRPQLVPGQKEWPAPAVLDAYCSHLGAHLALGGGKVEGDCVRCPFHGWRFGADGKLVSVPTSSDVPKGADIRSWPCSERNGVISVFMSSTVHPRRGGAGGAGKKALGPDGLSSACGGTCSSSGSDGAAGTTKPALPRDSAALSSAIASKGTSPAAPEGANKPWFTIPAFPQIDGVPGSRTNAPSYVYHGYVENVVNAVLFEIPENGSDVCHLAALHSQFIIPALSKFMSHKWAASWLAGEEARPHLADITVREEMCLFNYVLPGQVNVRITQCGPSQVYLNMSTPVGNIMIVETVTPVAPMTLRVLHAVYAEPLVPRLIAKVVLWSTMTQFNLDVPIWCNKKYEPRPVLVKEDSAIARYRSWIKQFSREGSITFEEAVRVHVADALGFPEDAALDW